MNYLNSSLVDRKIKEKAKADLKSRLEVSEVAKFDILKVLLSYLIALLGVESFFDFFKVVKVYEKIF